MSDMDCGRTVHTQRCMHPVRSVSCRGASTSNRNTEDKTACVERRRLEGSEPAAIIPSRAHYAPYCACGIMYQRARVRFGKQRTHVETYDHRVATMDSGK